MSARYIPQTQKLKEIAIIMNKLTYSTALILNILTLLLGQVRAQNERREHINKDRANALKQQKKPYVILISADGFRYDYASKYQTKNLLSFGKSGVVAKSLIPGYPSVTFPNHYSIVTGMYPSHHGLVNNSFLEEKSGERYSMGAFSKVRQGKWYGGTPIWVLAEQQKMLTANMFWVGSEAEIKGIRPTYYFDYTENITVNNRIDIIKNWLSLPEAKRPHLITFYISEPDHTGHIYGPEAPETIEALKKVDTAIYKLTEAIKPLGLPVNYIFVSDHGMTEVDRENPIKTPNEIDTAKYTIASSGTMMVVHAKNKADVSILYNKLKIKNDGYKVYLRDEMPDYLHYRSTDDYMNRIGDILLLPDWPRVFSNRRPGIGHHGFDPILVRDMQATFIAWGPSFKENKQIQSFENIHVYPLLTRILNLIYHEKIDGRDEVLSGILK